MLQLRSSVLLKAWSAEPMHTCYPSSVFRVKNLLSFSSIVQSLSLSDEVLHHFHSVSFSLCLFLIEIDWRTVFVASFDSKKTRPSEPLGTPQPQVSAGLSTLKSVFLTSEREKDLMVFRILWNDVFLIDSQTDSVNPEEQSPAHMLQGRPGFLKLMVFVFYAGKLWNSLICPGYQSLHRLCDENVYPLWTPCQLFPLRNNLFFFFTLVSPLLLPSTFHYFPTFFIVLEHTKRSGSYIYSSELTLRRNFFFSLNASCFLLPYQCRWLSDPAVPPPVSMGMYLWTLLTYSNGLFCLQRSWLAMSNRDYSRACAVSA